MLVHDALKNLPSFAKIFQLIGKLFVLNVALVFEYNATAILSLVHPLEIQKDILNSTSLEANTSIPTIMQILFVSLT
jgi:hypothetical protein